MKIKITEYILIKSFDNNSNIIESGQMEGDVNLIKHCFLAHIQKLNRKKESYFFKWEREGITEYHFNLKNSEFESFKKHFTNI
jgi:hypothetical protein